MRRLVSLVWLAALVAATDAHAAWSSSGGGLSKLTNNPWFVDASTAEVRYCVEVDREHFPFDEARVDTIIQDGLAFWRDEFAKHESFPATERLVGGQRFVRDCDGPVDIHFQFGFLTDEQKRQIPEHRSFLSLAVRTDYDLATLRGRGFVYFAPETGPDRPDADYLRADPWTFCDGCVLRQAVYHELGHVFGVPHDGPRHALMSEFHLEWLATQSALPPSLAPYPLLLKSDGQFRSSCGGAGNARWFGASDDKGCIHLRGDGSGIDVGWSDLPGGDVVPLGRIEIRMSHVLGRTVTSVRLPREQTVFLGASGTLTAFRGIDAIESQAVFRPARPNAPTKGVLVRLEAERRAINVLGFDDHGAPVMVYDYSVDFQP